MVELFPREEVAGIFRGFREGGMEFHADLVLPYRQDFHSIPMHGQFLLVQLESPDEAVLGRITSLSSGGKLAGGSGEQFNLRAVKEDRRVPEQLREDYLQYRVTIRVLGVLRVDDDRCVFVPSHRRLPHVGSPVAFPSAGVLRHIVGHHNPGAELGVLALGEYVWSAHSEAVQVEPWMQIMSPETAVRFPIENLVSRRSFIFARAGFGKSNLNKLLFSRLYSGTPVVPKRSRDVPVGTVVFDPDGEYFWPDDKGRPGLCDVPALQEKLVVFTNRAAPSAFYGSFVAGGIRLDIRRLKPSDVVSIALSPDKQDQQNVRKLRSMNPTDWASLVDLVHVHGNASDLELIQKLLRLEKGQDAEALAARANMTAIARMLHDPSSRLMDLLLQSLSDGKLCIIDVSQLRGGPSLVLSGLILRRIFDRNQEEFTKASPRTIPTIAVVEEAQSVLDDRNSASGPYIEWVKEGRKYDLGAVLVTQQPGSIPKEILSQGDNWFIFHLLSAGDLRSVNSANAHFSEDILSTLLNEPIAGQGVFWSGVSGTVYPIPLRVLSFETLHTRQDPHYRRDEVETYARTLREQAVEDSAAAEAVLAHVHVQERQAGSQDITRTGEEIFGAAAEGGVDVLRAAQERAIEALRKNEEFWDQLDQGGIPWGRVIGLLKEALPESMDDRDQIAVALVPKAIEKVLEGPQNLAWTTERRGSKQTLFILRGAKGR